MLVKVRDNKKIFESKIMLVILMSAFITGSCIPAPEAIWEEAITTHSINVNESEILQEQWILEDVYSFHEANNISLSAQKGFVYFQGSVNQNSIGQLIALSTDSRKVVWKGPRTTAFTASSEAVYTADGINFSALDHETGKVLWKQRLPFYYANIAYIFLFENILQIATSGEFLLVDKDTGEIIETSTDPTIFPYAPYWLMRQEPTFIEDLVIYNVLTMDTGIRAVDRDTISFNIARSGNIKWESDPRVISNVAASNKHAFIINAFDNLLIFDLQTGEVLETLKIEPSIEFYNIDVWSQHRGYHLAVDRENNMLFVLLGDSNQLFAFQILE